MYKKYAFCKIFGVAALLLLCFSFIPIRVIMLQWLTVNDKCGTPEIDQEDAFLLDDIFNATLLICNI